MPPKDTTIEVHERLARMETLLEQVCQAIKDQNDDIKRTDGKIDKILDNDKDKLQRIARNEATLKSTRMTLWLFAVPIAGALANSIVGWF